MLASSATIAGGCAAFSRSSATLNNALLDGCTAPVGGGLFAGAGSNISVLHGSVRAGTGAQGAGMYINSSWVVGAYDGRRSIVQDCPASDGGGGVFITGNQSSIQFFDVLNCSAPHGGGIVVQNAYSGTMTSISISESNATKYGGGIFVQSAKFKVADVKVSNNTAAVGGGVFAVDSSLSGSISVTDNNGTRGGGFASSGTTSFEGANITSNTAQQRGGGLAVETGVLSLKSTRIISCSADDGVGGGISVTNGTVKHYALTVQNCSSIRGGGIYANASEFYQYPSEESSGMGQFAASLTQNRATDYGGSIFIDGMGTQISDVVLTDSSASFGGGVAALDAQECVVLNMDISTSKATSGGGLFFGSGTNCVLRSSRVANNNATESGGGLTVQDAKLYHSNLDITNNVAPTAGGVKIQSDAVTSSLLWWAGPETDKSRIYANVISPVGGNAANVLLNCSVECVLSGAQIFGGTLSIGQGAGVFVSGGGSATISNALIANNSAVQGGGIAIGETEFTTLENVAFVGNFASGRGGGLWAGQPNLLFFPTVNVNSCVFYNNSATAFGGGMSLYKVVMLSSILLVVENHVNDSDTGSGGGLYADAESDITADTWLFLSNDATIGGAICGVAASKISLLESDLTRDVRVFFSRRWQELFLDLVGLTYVEGLAKYSVGVQRGGLVYLSDKDSVLELLSASVTYGSADAGGGIYLTDSAFLYGDNTQIGHNSAVERGGGLCVSNSAQARFDYVEVIFSGKKYSMQHPFVVKH